MIELIFVILVLGILAAIAIPKLSATRDDALVVKVSQNIAIVTTEIASYAVAKGQILDDLSLMSNTVRALVARGEASLDLANKAVDIVMGAREDCVRIEIVTSGNNENLTILLGDAGDSRCDALQNLFDSGVYPIVIRGEQIVY